MSTCYIFTTSREKPDFEFDATLNVSKNRTYTATKRAIENRGDVADHVYRQPFTVSTDGFVAITPISPRRYRIIPTNDPSVLAVMRSQLEELAEQRQLVTLVSDLYAGKVVITSLSFSNSVEDGYSLMTNISFSEIEIAKLETTVVSASRLRPKVKKRAATAGGNKAADQSKNAAATSKAKLKAGLLYRAFN
jgi:hypothetical protein